MYNVYFRVVEQPQRKFGVAKPSADYQFRPIAERAYGVFRKQTLPGAVYRAYERQYELPAVRVSGKLQFSIRLPLVVFLNFFKIFREMAQNDFISVKLSKFIKIRFHILIFESALFSRFVIFKISLVFIKPQKAYFA